MGTMSWNHQSRLLVSINHNDVDAIKALLEQGLDPDLRFRLCSGERPAICLCTERGNINLLKVLLEWGCSINQPDSHGLSALHIAANHGYVDMVALLLKERAQVNAVTLQGETPLLLASQRHSVDVVRMLVEAGADVDRCDNQRKTPLLNACIQSHAAMADFLLSHKARVNTCSLCGNTPLLFAAGAPLPNVTLISRLLRADANANYSNLQGETPLHAVFRGSVDKPNRLDAVDLLLSRKCDLDARNCLGQTPLHLAVQVRDADCASRLVTAGCAVECEDKLGLTPLFYVVRDGNYALAALLYAAGAKVHYLQWMSDPELLCDFKDPALLQWLIAEVRKAPTLSQMCRLAFRTHYGPNAQIQIGKLVLPTSLKRYLALDTL